MENGWIRLHRSLLSWEWMDTPEMVGLWVNILLRANEEDMERHGRMIRRGQMVTTLPGLAAISGLTVKQVRTCLDRLIKAGLISTESANNCTIITISQYDDFSRPEKNEGQTKGQTKGRRATDEGQTKGRQKGRQRADANTCELEGCAMSPSDEGQTKGQTKGRRGADETQADTYYPLTEVKDNKETHTSEYIYSSVCAKKESENTAFSQFVAWIKTNAPAVAEMKQPFTEEQYNKLMQLYSREEVEETLLSMTNKPDLAKKYVSAYLTCRNWCKRERERAEDRKTKRWGPAPHKESMTDYYRRQHAEIDRIIQTTPIPCIPFPTPQP